MIGSKLRDFNNDKAMVEEVKEYLITFLRETAIKKVFNKEDTSAIAEANDVINHAFDNLNDIFESSIKKPKLNESR